MLREAQIPFLLWLPAALLVHMFTGGSAFEAAQVENGKIEILAFSREVRQDVASSLRVVEVSFLDDGPLEEKEPEPEDAAKDDDAPDADADDEDEEDAKTPPKQLFPPKTPPKLPPPPKTQPKPKVAKKEPPKPKPKVAKKDPPKPKPKPKVAKKDPPKPKPKPKVAKKDPPKPKVAKKKPPPKLQLPKPDGRIAVINDPSLKKTQKDNPNAKRIADQANTVKEETMAQLRSYDQNASKPTGGRQLSPTDAPNPGNAADTKQGFSNEVKSQQPPRSGSEGGPTNPEKQPVARSPKAAGSPGAKGAAGRAGQKGLKAVEAGKGPSAPGAATAPGGSWSLSPEAGGDGKPLRKGRKGRRAIAAIPGLAGGPKAGVLGPRYSISAFGLMEALGKKHLRREEQRARNTRLARHRGKFKTNQFQKYRAAIENYDPTVKPGNQTSLNAARVPFASYINRMHNRIHPIFADGFLGGLSALPPKDPLQDMKLTAHAEIVLDGQTGAVIRAGIVRTSGITAFDAGAIAAIHSAGPYGQPPEVIHSTDGNVYLHWEFYRDPFYACTSRFAAPYIVNVPKKGSKTPGPLKPIRKPARKGEKAGPRKKAPAKKASPKKAPPKPKKAAKKQKK